MTSQPQPAPRAYVIIEVPPRRTADRGCGHTAAEHAATIREALVRHDLDREIDEAAGVLLDILAVPSGAR